MKLIGVAYCTRKRRFSQALAGNSHYAPGTAQPMYANQVALRAFNGIAPPGLQRGVILPD